MISHPCLMVESSGIVITYFVVVAIIYSAVCATLIIFTHTLYRAYLYLGLLDGPFSHHETVIHQHFLARNFSVI